MNSWLNNDTLWAFYYNGTLIYTLGDSNSNQPSRLV